MAEEDVEKERDSWKSFQEKSSLKQTNHEISNEKLTKVTGWKTALARNPWVS